METKSLAQRCFDSVKLDDELFTTICHILGADSNKCLDEGFSWPVEDVYYDEYDCSIEIIRPEGIEWMTPEQISAVLKLGFYFIYESIGENAKIHEKGRTNKCSARQGDKVNRLKATINALRERLKEKS